LPAMSAEMKMTPIVGEMNANDIAIALGNPREFRFSWLGAGSADWTSVDMVDPPHEANLA
jgi:hypothetical protein